MRLMRFLLLGLLACSFLAMAKKQTLMVRFHVEANGHDGASFVTPAKFHNPNRDGFVERVASISERNIVGVFPVSAADGSFGCAFKLDYQGTLRLQTLSTEKRGSSILGFINTALGSHPVVDMVIDKPITDGIIFIPRGLTQLEIDQLQKDFPTLGKSQKRG